MMQSCFTCHMELKCDCCPDKKPCLERSDRNPISTYLNKELIHFCNFECFQAYVLACKKCIHCNKILTNEYCMNCYNIFLLQIDMETVTLDDMSDYDIEDGGYDSF